MDYQFAQEKNILVINGNSFESNSRVSKVNREKERSEGTKERREKKMINR